MWVAMSPMAGSKRVSSRMTGSFPTQGPGRVHLDVPIALEDGEQWGLFAH